MQLLQNNSGKDVDTEESNWCYAVCLKKQNVL